jgi:hypothetical protein
MGFYDFIQNIFEHAAPPTYGQAAGFPLAHEIIKNPGSV